MCVLLHCRLRHAQGGAFIAHFGGVFSLLSRLATLLADEKDCSLAASFLNGLLGQVRVMVTSLSALWVEVAVVAALLAYTHGDSS